MTATSRPSIPRSGPVAWTCGVVGLAALAVGLASGNADPPTAKEPAGPALFADWPKGAKPDAVIVLSGQTFGYLQPCGCSRPQLGGLERRANFIAALKAKGWPVVGVDLGDILPMAAVVPDQLMLKYATTMAALREMGYVAVGVGKAEFTNGLYRVLGQYALVKEQPPFVLAGNAGGRSAGKDTSRAEAFPGPGKRPMVGLTEVVEVGGVPVGVAGVVGPSVQKTVDALPRNLIGITPQADALAEAVKEFAADPKKPRLLVLLYQGTLDEAKAVAKARPEFHLILCRSDESDPPDAPDFVAHADGHKTMIVRIGYKGRNVGAVGAFKQPGGGFELRYQLVPLGESFVTAGDEDAARKANPVLPVLDSYATQVRAKNFMGKFPQGPHPAQAQAAKDDLVYVGSEKCAACHAGEHAKWKDTPHSRAMDDLEKKPKRPALRNFDGECVVCHTVGFGYKTGYRDDLTTPLLRHVGCESCHGPGSGHAADPKNARLLALQSPWRQDRADRLPDAATMEALAKLEPDARVKVPLKPTEQRMLTAVSRSCSVCHDSENDPNFELVSYWPKVSHAAKK